MDKLNKRVEPKKIKMPPLVDRSNLDDTLSFDSEWLHIGLNNCEEIKHEDYSENNSQSIPELESM